MNSDFPLQAKKARTKIIEIAREYLKNNDESTFLDMILRPTEKRIPGTEEHISEESAENLFIEVLFGSNETTSSTMCAMLMQLYKHPHVVDKVLREVDENVKEHGECLVFDPIVSKAFSVLIIGYNMIKGPLF